MKKRLLFIALILGVLTASVSCDNTLPEDTEVQSPEVTDTITDVATEPVDDHVQEYTYSGVEIPSAIDGGQYLPTDSTDAPQEGKIVYSVNSTNAGYIDGFAVQSAGEASFEVEAVAKLGYKFISWSDGSTDPKRSGDTEEGVYTAIFDYDVLDLPIIVINTENGRRIRSKEWYIGATVSVLGCEEEYVINEADMEIRGRGNASWGFDKKSYKFKLADKTNLFGMANGRERIWVLLANHCDQSLLRNHIAMELGRSLDGIAWEPSSLQVELYLNGEYVGVYLLAEEIKISGDRVNVADTTPDVIDTGYLLEMTHYADHDDETIMVAKTDFVIHNELSTDPKIKAAQKEFIQEYVDSCYQSLKRGDYEKANELMDLDSLVAAYILQETVKNHDSQWDNFYLWKDSGGKLHFGPYWDFDIALGNSWEESSTYTDLLAGNGRGAIVNLSGWFPVALMNDWFRQLVVDEWNEIYGDLLLLPQYVTEEAERHIASYERNFIRWPIFGERQNLEPEAIMALKNYTEHYTYLSDWLMNRIEWLNEAYNHEDFVTKGEGLDRVRRSSSND